MYIRAATAEDLPEMERIYARARRFMAENGNPTQWVDGYPRREMLEEDIRQGRSYVCAEGERVLGTFCFAVAVEPTYLKIYEGDWLNDAPYGVVHRIASGGDAPGVASFCLQWCLEACGNIRIDTHRNNRPMQGALAKNGYAYCGIIYLANGDERLAYQRVVEG